MKKKIVEEKRRRNNGKATPPTREESGVSNRYFHFGEVQFVCILCIIVFPCRLFVLLFTGLWQSLVSLLAAIYFGTIVFVRVIVFQCHFPIFCCFPSRLYLECECKFSRGCFRLHEKA